MTHSAKEAWAKTDTTFKATAERIWVCESNRDRNTLDTIVGREQTPPSFTNPKCFNKITWRAFE